MKNLCSKSKGKIHPSPSLPSAFGPASGRDALEVLKLLPAAIFALTAALAVEDREVVAYLMIRSINGSWPAVEEQRCCCKFGGGVTRRPLFDCGCFDCYTSFWSRWDCSEDRETIHMVIEAFEEYLGSEEKMKGKERKRKRKKREGKARASDEKTIVEVAPVAACAEAAAAESKGFKEEVVTVSDGCFAEESEDSERNEGNSEESVAAAGERRRGWVDLAAMFNYRLWSLWGPGV